MLITFFIPSAFAMKIEYQNNEDEEEYHTGAIITLGKNDTNPALESMKLNYNRLGAVILKGANENKKRSFQIKGITSQHMTFVRAIMKKASEIAEERQVPFVLSFYDENGKRQDTLSLEWEPLQKEIDKFYVNPWGKALRNLNNYDSD